MRAAQRVTVAIASEETLLRESLADRIDREPGFRIVGRVAGVAGISALLARKKPHVLLLDVDGLATLPEGMLTQLLSRWPGLKILILSRRLDELAVARALRSGAAGAVGKGDELATLFRALAAVASGLAWAGRRAVERALSGMSSRASASTESLTRRERELFGLLAQGYRNKEIASQLRIKEQTVKIHLHNLFRKLNVRTRVEAALKAADYT